MPHLVILYSGNLERATDMDVLCRQLANTLIDQRDDAAAQVFPTGGTRVLAYPSAHHAVADGSGDFGFIYMTLRMARGRSAALQRQIGEALVATARAHFAPMLAEKHVGITLHIDEGAEVFDGKFGNLHALFQPSMKKD